MRVSRAGQRKLILLTVLKIIKLYMEIWFYLYIIYDIYYTFYGTPYRHRCLSHTDIFSFICSFIKARSELCVEDVKELVEFGLELFRVSENKLYAQVLFLSNIPLHLCSTKSTCLFTYDGSSFGFNQVRWGNLLVRILNKYRKKLNLKVQWRPFYDTLVHTHFTRQVTYTHLNNSLFQRPYAAIKCHINCTEA